MQNKIEKTGDWFVDQLSLYQNANSDNVSVKRNFVVRVSEFELIMSNLRTKKSKDPLQHELLLGRRGSGKSTLLKRIQIEIEEDVTLNQKYSAINLAEEQAGIYRLSDLWFEALKELSLQTNQTLDLQSFVTFKDNQEYTRYLHSKIHEILTKSNKKAVLLLDNIDRIVENLDDDGHLLRETLLNYNDLQIIGGSTRMDEHFWKYDKPFYEFFRRHRLVGLSFEEIDMLLNQWSVALDLPILKDYAKKNKGKIEALRILTDGLPRTLQFFIQILLQDATLYGFDYIKKVMDKASPLYQERLNNLTAPQRKIVLEMAFIWEACSTKQLVEVCRMEGKLISSFLKQLNSFGIVETIQTNTKNHLYRLSERFFNMWLIITQGNPNQKRKAKWLTIFLETWYDGNEIQELAKKHLVNIKANRYTFDQAAVLTKAISQSKYIGVNDRDELIESTNMLNEPASIYYNLPVKYQIIKDNINTLRKLGKYEEALLVINDIENEEDGVKYFLFGYFHNQLGNIEKAIKYYLMSIDKGESLAANNLGVIYEVKKNWIEAEKYYKLGANCGEPQSLNNLALIYQNQKKYDKAISHYKLAIEKHFILAYFNLATLYQELNNWDDAMNNYLLAIKGGYYYAYNNLANIYSIKGNLIEAEKCYLLAMDNNNDAALFNLILFYLENNIQKNKSFELINDFANKNKSFQAISLKLIVEVWNNKFNNVEKQIKILYNEFFDLDWVIEELLYLEQTTIILSIFEDKDIGQAIKEKYQLLYYATLILNNKIENNLLLRIPPDVMPTVNEMVAQIKAKQEFYSN